MAFKKKFNKYGNVKTVVDGIKFDSKKEGSRFLELKARERAGLISNVETQPKFLLQEKYRDKEGKAIREINYSADFKYIEVSTGKEIIEDVKGHKKHLDPVFKLKKKMLLHKYPDINFREIYKVTE